MEDNPATTIEEAESIAIAQMEADAAARGVVPSFAGKTPEARADRTEYEKNRSARAKDPFHGTIHEGDKKLIKEAKDKEKKFNEIA